METDSPIEAFKYFFVMRFNNACIEINFEFKMILIRTHSLR